MTNDTNLNLRATLSTSSKRCVSGFVEIIHTHSGSSKYGKRRQYADFRVPSTSVNVNEKNSEFVGSSKRDVY